MHIHEAAWTVSSPNFNWLKSLESSKVSIIVSCCCSVAQSCPTLYNPKDCSMPGFPVLHNLLECVQTHVHWTGDAIQPSHPLLSPTPPALNLSQRQSLYRWVGSTSGGPSIGASTSVPPMNIQGWFSLGLTCLISLQSKGLSRVPLRWSGGEGFRLIFSTQWKTPTAAFFCSLKFINYWDLFKDKHCGQA